MIYDTELSNINQIIKQKAIDLNNEDAELNGFTMELDTKRKNKISNIDELKTHKLNMAIDQKIDEYAEWLKQAKKFIKKIKKPKKKRKIKK